MSNLSLIDCIFLVAYIPTHVPPLLEFDGVACQVSPQAPFPLISTISAVAVCGISILFCFIKLHEFGGNAKSGNDCSGIPISEPLPKRFPSLVPAAYTVIFPRIEG